MENFYEQFQTKDYYKQQTLYKNISYGILVVAIGTMIFLGLIPAIIVVMFYGLWLLFMRNQIVEYEYELTVDELVVTKILNQSSRKLVGEINIRDIIEVKNIDDAKKKNCKIIKGCLNEIKEKDIVVFLKGNNEIVGYHLALNNEIFNVCKRLNPMAFVHNYRG